MTICLIADCRSKAWCCGWCQKHYSRWWRNGDPTILLNREPSAFFKKALDYVGDDCLFWPFTRNNKGYPMVGQDGKVVLVHRLICERIHGKPPKKKPFVAHSCGNGHLACIAQKHLRWASRKDNSDDMILHGTRLKGEAVAIARLNEKQALEIFARAHAGETLRALGAEFGVDHKTVSCIKLGYSWGWLTGAVPKGTLMKEAGRSA